VKRELYESFRDLQIKSVASSNEKKELGVEVDNQTEDEGNESAIYPILSGRKKQAQVKPTKKKVSFAPLPRVTDDNQNVGSDMGKDEPAVLEINGDGAFDVSAIRQASLVATKSESKMEESSNQSDDRGVADSPAFNLEASTESDDDNDDDSDVESAALPPPRAPVKSEIEFTPRVFPTPSRESKASEEEDWLVKNRRHLASHKGLRRAGDYDISESDRTISISIILLEWLGYDLTRT
jgi:hypothetical protein